MIRSISLAAALAAVSSVAFAQGAGAVVVQGNLNQGIGTLSTAVGGFENIAAGGASTVVGGGNNVADLFATVTGGRFNQAASYSGVSSGYANLSTVASHVGGGVSNVASNFSSVGGGVGNKATGIGSSVLGGGSNTASGVGASVLSGSGNTASGDGSVVVSGKNATASTSGSVVIADQLTTAGNAVNNSLLLSFANGISTSGTLYTNAISVNVSTNQATGVAPQTPAAAKILAFPSGGNVVRLINNGVDKSSVANNFAAANLTQNQDVVIDGIAAAPAGTVLVLIVDNTGTANFAGNQERQSIVLFRDSATQNGQAPAAAANPALATGANLQLGATFNFSSMVASSDVTGITTGNAVANTNTYTSIQADDDDVLTLVSDGTRWIEVAFSAN